MSDQVRTLAGGGGAGWPRLPVALIAGVVVALVVGLVVGRATAPHNGDDRPSGSAAPSADSQPARRVGSVPVGYPRTRAGAVSATLNGGVERVDDVRTFRAAGHDA